jgi:hypothetical protein
MKQLFTILSVSLALLSTASADVLSAAIPNNTTVLLSTNRADVYTVAISNPSSVNTVAFEMFDCDTTAAPYYGTNYVVAAWASKTEYASNIVTSYVGYTGVTNWYTNAALFSMTITNAASTNKLPALLSGSVSPNSTVTYNVNAIFTEGVAVKATTNANVNVYYRSSN